MELAHVFIPLSAQQSSGGDGSHAKRKLETIHSALLPSEAPSPTAASYSYKSLRANVDALPPVDMHLKAPRCSTTRPLSLTRCYSDGKIRKAFGELLHTEVMGDDQDLPTRKIYSSSPDLMVHSIPEERSNCIGPSPRNPFLSEETSPLSIPRVSKSPVFNTNSFNDDGLIITPLPMPKKRVCSQQSSTPSKSEMNPLLWATSLTKVKKRSLGVVANTSSSEKSASLSIDRNLQRCNNTFGKALSSPSVKSSLPLVSVSLRGNVNAPKRMNLPPQRRSRNPGNLSLDLSQVDIATATPRTSAFNNVKRRNDEAAECSRLLDFLYIGGATVAKNKSMLTQHGITHIINCAASVAPISYPDDFNYFNIMLRDHSSQDIARHFYSVFDFIERARKIQGRVFLHCVKGISRSPTIAIAYLMWYKNIGMYKALDLVRQARPSVDPNVGFVFQLTEWEHLHPEGKLKFPKTIVFRMDIAYADSKESCNRDGLKATKTPLFEGPLLSVSQDYFRDPTKDIGGLCLIVACADYMFVWCGTDVTNDQVEVAKSGAQLLQCYEAFPVHWETVRQGQEPVAFWNLVGDDPSR
ncbi:hypothetical protein CCR75_004729 [Bremia lactucae]|uniref:Protein-serine/threonine phosphatase n=1 Tax=Bremia lactucae TaxID=4779 RepID=A0A976NZC3_BRELC|nr:hypothetical protein CCR75_004729 [Bremia lactucae]